MDTGSTTLTATVTRPKRPKKTRVIPVPIQAFEGRLQRDPAAFGKKTLGSRFRGNDDCEDASVTHLVVVKTRVISAEAGIHSAAFIKDPRITHLGNAQTRSVPAQGWDDAVQSARTATQGAGCVAISVP